MYQWIKPFKPLKGKGRSMKDVSRLKYVAVIKSAKVHVLLTLLSEIEMVIF